MRRSHGGNARKQKRELTDATFLSVISGTDESLTALSLPRFLARMSPMTSTTPSATLAERIYDQGLAPINGFVFSRFELGTAHCSNCQCELMYYQDREILRRALSIRCRVCQELQTISLGDR